jgi:hypothetical protein
MTVEIWFDIFNATWKENNWIFTEKYDGTNRARAFAQVFSNVGGKDFTDSQAPVMTNLAFRLAFIIKVLKKLRYGEFDIETGCIQNIC